MPKDGLMYVGVDLGATKILAAAFDGKMKVLATAKVRTPREGGGKTVVKAIREAVSTALLSAGEGRSLAGVGVAVPAPLDREKGIVLYTPNMGLKNYPLGDEIADLFGAPARLENDVQAGTYGELRAGALRGRNDAVGVFVGTGIGGAVIIGGKPYRGSSGSAGEVGHMILQEGGPLCGCGNYGCLEALASRTAMARDALAMAVAGRAPGMLEAAGADIRKYRSSAFEAAIKAGDDGVKQVIERAAFWLGVGLANLVNVLNPEAIVLGGGMVVRFGDIIRHGALRSMRERVMPGLEDRVELLVTELGDLAVPTGAAYLAAEAIGDDRGEGQ